MTVKDLKHLLILCAVIIVSVTIMFAENTLESQQSAIIDQGAYFYGMSHLLKEDTVTKVDEEKNLESKAFFWGVHF